MTEPDPFSILTKSISPIGTAVDGHETTYTYRDVIQFSGGGPDISYGSVTGVTSSSALVEVITQGGNFTPRFLAVGCWWIEFVYV